MAEFGKPIRDKFFLEFEGPNAKVYLNHGSYGALPRPVWEAKVAGEKLVNSWPDYYWDAELAFTRWMQTLEKVADFLHVSKENTVLIRNVTEAMTVVFASIQWKKDDAILLIDSNFSATQHLIHHITSGEGCPGLVRPGLVRLDLWDAIHSKESILQKYEECLDAHPNIRLAVIEGISCTLPLRMPFEEMIKISRTHGVKTFLDAAHMPGHEDVHYEDLDADYIGGNFYKWLFSPRPSGFLWIAPQYREEVNPITLSKYFPKGFHRRFWYPSSTDNTGLEVVANAIDFFQELGGYKAILGYSSAILDKVVPRLAESIGTKLLKTTDELVAPCFRLLKLPELKQFEVSKSGEGALTGVLYERFKVSARVVYFKDSLWVRLSCNVYNTEQDFEALEEAFKVLISESRDTS